MKNLTKILAVGCAAMLATLTGCSNKNGINDRQDEDEVFDSRDDDYEYGDEYDYEYGDEYGDESALLNKLASAPVSDCLEYEQYDGGCDVDITVPQDEPLDIVVLPSEHGGQDVTYFHSIYDINYLVVNPDSLGKLEIDTWWGVMSTYEILEGIYYDGVLYPAESFVFLFNRGYDPKRFLDNGLYLSEDGKTVLRYEPELDKREESLRASVVIPEGVEKIGESAFRRFRNTGYNTTAPFSVQCPSTLKVIGEHAFEDSKLTGINLPDGLQEIGSNAFEDTDLLTEISFPDGLQEIDYYAFNSSGLSGELIIPDSVTKCGGDCFENTDITSLTIGKGLTKIDCFGGTSLTEVTIPSNIERVSDYCFFHCDKLETVIFEDGCKRIDDAFAYCSELKNVTLPSTLTTLDLRAFENCPSLNELVIPDNTRMDFNASSVNEFNPNLRVTYRGKVYTPDEFSELCAISKESV